MHFMPVIGALQNTAGDSADSGDWWFRFTPGDAVGAQWLEFLLGLIVIWILCRMLYSTMLYSRVGVNQHPANFRKIIIAVGLLFSMLCLYFVFSNVLGVFVLILLGVAWAICALIFTFTRRKVTSSQS